LELHLHSPNTPSWCEIHVSVEITYSYVTASVAGKAGNKEGGPEEKKDDGELWCNVEAQAAFLGPNLWDKTLPYDADLKVGIHVLNPWERNTG
jgi:hypothetical protein